MTDTLFADVSEYQVPVDDSYPYLVLSIRVCDGTYQDHNFAANYAWMRAALDSGRMTFGIVYSSSPQMRPWPAQGAGHGERTQNLTAPKPAHAGKA